MQNQSIQNGALRSFITSPGFLVLAAVFLLVCAVPAFASDAGTGGATTGLPWEAPIKKISQSVSGPIAFAFSLLGVIGCGAGLIWGGEIGEFMRKLIMLVLVISLIVFANSLLTGVLFSGATLPLHAMLAPVTTASAG